MEGDFYAASCTVLLLLVAICVLSELGSTVRWTLFLVSSNSSKKGRRHHHRRWGPPPQHTSHNNNADAAARRSHSGGGATPPPLGSSARVVVRCSQVVLIGWAALSVIIAMFQLFAYSVLHEASRTHQRMNAGLTEQGGKCGPHNFSCRLVTTVCWYTIPAVLYLVAYLASAAYRAAPW